MFTFGSLILGFGIELFASWSFLVIAVVLLCARIAAKLADASFSLTQSKLQSDLANLGRYLEGAQDHCNRQAQRLSFIRRNISR